MAPKPRTPIRLLATAALAAFLLATPFAGAVVPKDLGVVAPIAPRLPIEGKVPTYDCYGREQGHEQAKVLCPDAYAGASCVGAGLAAVAETLGQPTHDIQGLSRAAASAYAWNGYGYSQSSGSGALADVRVLGGLAAAGTVESNCSASAYASGNYRWTHATAHADAQRVSLLHGALRAEVLADDSTVSNLVVSFPTQGEVLDLCAGPCTSVAFPPNTVIPLGPGLSLTVNWRQTGPAGAYYGKTLTQGAALVLQVEPVGPDPGALVFVAYTAAAA